MTEDRNWIIVSGFSEERDFREVERLHYSSALVSPKSALSLRNALNNCTEAYDYKLPEYKEDGMEFRTPPFILKGWIIDKSGENKLDRYDPWGANIAYPPYDIDPTIMSLMNVRHDPEYRIWKIVGCDEPCLKCTIWKTGEDSEDKSNFREGRILVASLDFLVRLCAAKNVDIIIDIQIERDDGNRSYDTDSTKKLKLPTHNALLVSKRGLIYE